jgi:hypothetical protein
MAAKRKYRKAPGAKASLESLKKYEQHIKEVDKHNASLETEKKQIKATRERIKKAKAKR